MHTVTTLKKSSEGSIREMILHLEQMDKLGHLTAFLYNLIKEVSRVVREFLNGLLVSENAVLFVHSEFVHTKVRFTRHQKAILDNVNKAEAKEIKRNMHEVRS